MRKGAVLKSGLVILVAGLAIYAGLRTWSSRPAKPAEIAPPHAETAADFQLKALTYSISGTVTAPDGSAIPEAMVTLDDPAGSSIATDGEGRYYFADLAPPTHVLTVSKPGSVAETKSIDITDADISVDFLLQPVICAVSGTVTASDGTPLGLAKIEINGPKYLETVADNKGYYASGELPSGTYALTASKDGYVPEAKTIDIVDPNTVADFVLAVPTRTMWGVVTASDGTALAGVAIEISGPVWNRTTTRNTGGYYFEALLPGTYTVTAAKSGYMDQTRTMEISAEDLGCDFVLPVRTYTISGIVATADGTPVSEVQVEFNGLVWGQAATDYSGRYSKGELPPGTYTVTTTKAGFVPKSQTVVIADLDVALDFVLNVLEVQ